MASETNCMTVFARLHTRPANSFCLTPCIKKRTFFFQVPSHQHGLPILKARLGTVLKGKIEVAQLLIAVPPVERGDRSYPSSQLSGSSHSDLQKVGSSLGCCRSTDVVVMGAVIVADDGRSWPGCSWSCWVEVRILVAVLVV